MTRRLATTAPGQSSYAKAPPSGALLNPVLNRGLSRCAPICLSRPEVIGKVLTRFGLATDYIFLRMSKSARSLRDSGSEIARAVKWSLKACSRASFSSPQIYLLFLMCEGSRVVLNHASTTPRVRCSWPSSDIRLPLSDHLFLFA